MSSKKIKAFGIPVILVVILDQLTKHWIRTSPSFQNWDIIPGWLAFHYTQNPGMAMGMQWASTKVISVVAIAATIGIFGYVMYNRKRATGAYMVCMGLILGGAIGNIIDRLVMARLESYGGVLEGHVVDFIYFTATIGEYPVFPYIFNVADMAISVAIISMIVFHKRIMPVENMDNGDGEDESLQGDPTTRSARS